MNSKRLLLTIICGFISILIFTACAISEQTTTIEVDVPATPTVRALSTGTQEPADTYTPVPTKPRPTDTSSPEPSEPAPTDTFTPGPAEPQPVSDQLGGLSIEQFFENSYQLILARDPELLVELGLADMLEDAQGLTDFSPEYLQETYQLHQEILEVLYQYDYDELSIPDQISYEVYENYLLWKIKNYEDSEYEYLVTPLSIRSWPQLFVMFFTDTHPLTTRADAEAYVARVHLLGDKIDGLLALLEMQNQAGVIPPRLVIELGIQNLQSYYGNSPLSSRILTTFLNKSSKIPDLDSDHRSDLIEELETSLRDDVYPAYQRLGNYLDDLLDQAPDDISLSTHEGGLEYYESLLRHFTTLDLTADEIHTLGLIELERIQTEMREKFRELGYPTEESYPVLYQKMIEESGSLLGNEVKQEYERILQTADEQLEEYFGLRPEGVLEVVGGDIGAFYSSGSLDGTRPGRFYAVTTSSQAIYKMKTVAYHEGIPGHHYQISVAIQSDLPLFRNLLIFDGYAEGWGLYAEYLASELGWYSDDPYGDLGRLQYEALRACRMIVDTGIHTKGWSYNQAVDFIESNTGIPRGFAEGEVIRYISYPGQAPSYLLGKIEIMRLRALAEEALGDKFDFREFHNVVLENGSMPLTTLEKVVMNWIESY